MGHIKPKVLPGFHRLLTPTTNMAEAAAAAAAANNNNNNKKKKKKSCLTWSYLFDVISAYFRNSLKHGEHFITDFDQTWRWNNIGWSQTAQGGFFEFGHRLAVLSAWQTLPSRPWARRCCASLGTWLPKVLLLWQDLYSKDPVSNSEVPLPEVLELSAWRSILLLLFLGSTCTKYIQTSHLVCLPGNMVWTYILQLGIASPKCSGHPGHLMTCKVFQTRTDWKFPDSVCRT